jgi:heme exporter protein B
MTFWRQALVVARRDLLAEGRSGEVLWVVVPFALVALFLTPVALGVGITTLGVVGPGVFWVVLLLFGLFVTIRRSGQMTAGEADAMALLLVDPAVGFVGRTGASFVLLVGVEVVMAPAMIALFGPPLPARWWLLIPVGLLAAAGLALTGTLAGSLVRGNRLGTTLAPLIASALSFPLLVGASLAGSGLASGGDILAPMALLALVVVGLAMTGVVTARPLEDGDA